MTSVSNNLYSDYNHLVLYKCFHTTRSSTTDYKWTTCGATSCIYQHAILFVWFLQSLLRCYQLQAQYDWQYDRATLKNVVGNTPIY